MIWIIIGIGIIAYFVVNASKKNREAADIAAQTSEKSIAYADYLKRTSKDVSFRDMTINELREFTASKIRSYNKETSDIDNGASVLYGVVILGAVVWAAASENFFPLILGVVAAIFISRYRDSSAKKVDEKYKNEGLDPYRLKITKAE